MVEIKEDAQSTEDGVMQIITVRSQSARMDYATQWSINPETQEVTLMKKKKARVGGDFTINDTPKAITQHHRQSVLEYIKNKNNQDIQEDNNSQK